jgi:hypothetical protein
MKSKLIGAVVAPISIVGLTFALGLGVTAFGTVGTGEQQQSETDSIISTLDVTTEVPVAPWCGWYVSSSDSTDIALAPDAGEPAMYIGTAIALTATADTNTAYVGSQAGLTAQGETTDCSWFTEGNKYGARYDVVADGNVFTAKAQTGTPGGTADEEMNFQATTANPLTITNIGIETCGADFVTNPTAELKDSGVGLTTTPWTVGEAAVVNNNFCKWSAKYEISIPAGMSPLYGNVNYRWTGPTLTHTLVIPEDQIGPDPTPE